MVWETSHHVASLNENKNQKENVPTIETEIELLKGNLKILKIISFRSKLFLFIAEENSLLIYQLLGNSLCFFTSLKSDSTFLDFQQISDEEMLGCFANGEINLFSPKFFY